ncbi:MAG: hypothetical protein IJT73_01570 [Selenomonadaceae bacterium]|nr:hypothetical protein [Selenomonadaceae bacterium]
MNFLSKLKSRKLSKTLAAVAASGILFFGANNVTAAPDDDANFEFRQAYLSLANEVRTFNQSIIFFGTTFHADINSQGQILRDNSMRMSGNINWEYTNPTNNQTTNSNMPFYMTHLKNEMMLYVQRNNKWSKFVMPNVPAYFADAMKSNDIKVLEENLNAVKNVEIFRDTEVQEIFNITLDGQYLAERLQEYRKQQDTTKLSAEEVAEQAKFFHHLESAFQKTDIVCTWTVDKSTNSTLTAVVDFTPVMRAYAENVLDEAAEGKIVISDEERKLMETIGYYSEFHYSMSSAKIANTQSLNPPSAARRAVINNNVFNDLFRDLETSARVR